jgi:hypothetical protein
MKNEPLYDVHFSYRKDETTSFVFNLTLSGVKLACNSRRLPRRGPLYTVFFALSALKLRGWAFFDVVHKARVNRLT